ncbi:MAG: hypothetical protein JAY90_03750 [Candidatus Thiodiazotropha lotti]|nr:hypothetical protein [Candidatus Thiodiazotropha lotti]
MSDKASLLKEIKEVFPFINKPQGLSLSFHKDGCPNCDVVRRHLEEYSGQELSRQALRYVHSEMGCLSAKGWSWVLPSLLRYCVGVDDTYDGVETEYLIYSLGPELKYQKEVLEHLSELNGPQVSCLIHFLEWCCDHPYWSGYCSGDIERAIGFMQSYRHNRKFKVSA